MILAETADVLIGVDTHRDAHALAVIRVASGEVLEQFEVRADPSGYRTALARVADLGPARRVWALEGSGSFGAGLRRHLGAPASGWWRSIGRAA